MAAKSIAAYIAAAPKEGQAQLRELHAILRSVAPDAQETIKWGAPFFVEPRFLFSFSANKAHLNFAPSTAAVEAFREQAHAQGYGTTKHYLQVRYDQPLPEALIRKIAKRQLKAVQARRDDSFW